MPLAPLFQPVRLGAVEAPNRMLMAPMTRGRAEADGTPNALMATYYVQRATAGLLVTEATPVSRQGVGWVGAPGMYTDAHVAGWRKVTEAVHAAKGRIFLQLWHMGRVSHPDFHGGALPVGPSAIAAQGETHTPLGKKAYVTPRALETAEIAGIVKAFGDATRRARDAGFDGVEVHGANGYLVDQFLRDGSNHRTDGYGGSVENRTRFAVEVAQACVSAWAADRVGFRVSPRGAYNDMADRDPAATFGRLAERLSPLGLAYLHVMEGLPGSMMHTPGERVSPVLRKAFRGALVANGGYDAAKAAAALAAGEADAVAFGVPFLCTPDFVARTQAGKPMNPPDFSTLYTPGAKGYTDYPALATA
jgi:N-ethylmaleimide reductase